METSIRFTKSSVAKLAHVQRSTRSGKPAWDTMYWDTDMSGFGLRCLPSGERRWIVQYRTADGTQRREKLGDPRKVSLDDAREAARNRLARVQLGDDPQAERKAARQAARVSEMVDDYLAAASKRMRPRSLIETTRHLRQHARPLHARPASAVGRQDVAELLAAVAANAGGVTANRVRSSLSAMWTWAVMEGRQDQSPVALTRKPATEASRVRVLTDGELTAIWQATASQHDHDRMVRLLMLTGARRDEVGRMQWAEIDGDLWTLPAARTKNGLPHELPLPPLAVMQFPAKAVGRIAVFGRTDSGFSGWSRCKVALDARLAKQLAGAFCKQHGRAPRGDDAKFAAWTLHDMRRTVSTWLSEHGDAPHVVEALLNHVSGAAKRGVAGVYNKAQYRDQKREALKRWAQHVAELIGQDTDSVTTLRRG